jgi:LPS export ABC transporter protein LptC
MLRISIIFIGILFSLFSCTNDPVEVRKINSDIVLPVSSTKNVEMLYSDSAKLRAKIKAPQRDTYIGENEYIEFTKGVDMIFYDADGKESGHMKAKYAISYNKKEQMIARNNVELWNAEGKRLDTEELIWDQKSGRIHSEKFSKITSPTEVIYGDGFESDQDFSKYRIVNISGIVSVKNE